MEVTGTEVADAASGTEAPDAVPANELTGSYDHLWDKTVMRRIEDAAVRDEPEEEPGGPARAWNRTARRNLPTGTAISRKQPRRNPSQVDAQPSFVHSCPCPHTQACLLRP